MRWPYGKRVEAAHAWGALAIGTAGIVGIPTVLGTLHAADQHFRWWWPTNWMLVPSVIIVIGLLLLAIPVLRPQSPAPNPKIFLVSPRSEVLGHAKVDVSQAVGDVRAETIGVDAREAGHGADISVRQEARDVRAKMTGIRIEKIGD